MLISTLKTQFHSSFFKTFYFVLGYSWLTNNVVRVLGVQQRASVIHKHVPFLLFYSTVEVEKLNTHTHLPGLEVTGSHMQNVLSGGCNNWMERRSHQANVLRKAKLDNPQQCLLETSMLQYCSVGVLLTSSQIHSYLLQKENQCLPKQMRTPKRYVCC